MSDFQPGQWIEFEETQLHPLHEVVDYYGTPLPLQNFTYEELIVTQKLVNLAEDDFFYVKDGNIEALRHGYRAYYNVDPSIDAVADTLEEAVNKVRLELWHTRPNCYSWRVIDGDAHTRQVMER